MHIVPPQRENCSTIEQLEERRLLSSPEAAALVAPDNPATVVAAPLATPQLEASTPRTPKAPLPETIFAHPSILNTEADFDRMRNKINVGAEPWLTGWNALISDGYSGTGWNPRPSVTVIRGGDGQNFGGMIVDMLRAYQTAVRWKITGDTAFAEQSIRILNAWSYTNTTLTGNADRFLASGLYAFGWAAAADIMRSYSGWAATDVTQFQNYLLNVFFPLQDDFLYGGDDARSHNGVDYPTHYWANWDLANIEGMMAIGIFCDRQDIYDRAVNYLYTGGGNGALDISHYYLHPGNLMQWQESGRDQGHTTLGMALMGHVAQMAWNQGLDLFSYNNYQFLAAAEYIAKYNLFEDVPFQDYTRYDWTMTDVSSGGRGHAREVYELIYNHYVNRLGMAAPYSEQRVMTLRPENRGSGDELGYGTLTFALDGFSTPQPPRGLIAAEKGAGNIQLDWFGGANVTSYKLYRATSANGTYTLVASNLTGLLSYTDRNLPPGEYFYKVTGVSGATETPASNIVSAISGTRAHTQLPFDENTGTTANDSTGNGHTGTLLNGASWNTGKTGSAVALDGSNDFVSLPQDILADADDFTVATWVYLNDSRMWSRIFDFGEMHLDGWSRSVPARWMFLTPRNGGGVVEFATTTVYGTNKQWVAGNAALPTNQWVHVAVTLADRVGKIYVNGVAVGANANMDFPPSQIRLMKQNYLGRSLYSADPYLNGKIDDFRIYNGAMDSGAIYTLATGNAPPAVPAAPATFTATAVPGNSINLNWSAVSGATNYTVWRSTTSGGPYTSVATLLSGTSYSDTGLPANIVNGTPYYYIVTAGNNGGDGAASPQASAAALPPMPAVPASFSAVSNSPTSISLTWGAASNAGSYSVKRSLTAGGPYTTVASALTTTSYIDSGLTSGTPYYYVVSAVNAAGASASSSEASDVPSDRRLRLTFHEAAGTNAQDVTGNGWNGTLVDGTLWSGGKMGTGIDLDGSNDHVTLPAGVVSGLTNVTLSSWINIEVLATWQRIFDFGTGTDNYMFLTTQYGGGPSNMLRFGIRTPSVGEQTIDSTVSTPLGSWVHVAVVLNEGTGTLYLNGAQVGQKTGMTLNPSSLGNTTQNYLGKSQWNDPYFNGKLDDFRIYTRALSGAEVSALATTTLPAVPPSLTATAVGNDQVDLSWPAVSGATGYTLLRATSSSGPYSLVASRLSSTSYQDSGLVPDLASGTTYYYFVQAENAAGDGPRSPQASALLLPPPPEASADFTAAPASSGTILLTWSAATNAASYRIGRATSLDGPYATIASGVTGTSYSDSDLTNGTTYYYLLTAVNAAGESVDPPGANATATDLRARYKFEETSGTTASDSSGHNFNGTLTNGPTWTASGKLGRALSFDGANDYVALPNGIVNGLTTTTLTAWVYLNSVTTNSRIFDFGSGNPSGTTGSYMFLSPRGGNTARFAITTAGYGSEQSIVGNAALPSGAWTHVAVVLNGSTGTLFVNGIKVGENTAMMLTPSSLGATTQNYLGKSQFGVDPYMNGRMDDFRIYSRALSEAEVTTLKDSTSPAAPTGLDATPGNAQVSLSWNAVAQADKYLVRRATTNGGPYTTIASDVTSTTYVDTSVANGSTYYYVVAAANMVDTSANSAQASATPIANPQLVDYQFVYNANPNQLIFTFDVAMDLDSGDLTVIPAGAGSNITASGYTWDSNSNSAIFTIPTPLPDGNYTANLPGGYSFPFFVLAADANHDGTVDSLDFNTFAGHYGGSNKLFSEGDFDQDGKVNTLDFNILAGHFGQAASLPAAPLASSPTAMLFSTNQLGINMEDELDEFVS